MPELAAIPKRQWATSEQVVKVLEGLLEEAKRGEIVAIGYACERRGEEFESGATKTNNCFALAGYMMSMAMRVMGFEDTRHGRTV